ncbi:MAG: hypothetical protein JW778_03320 [Candidatus Altiarchaeota archaeon]|nr:hypothetical protein [Candidatus Altiarchaeota archaeon]
MPKGYNISKLSRFGYTYEHIGSLLSIFSQSPVCKIMFLLDEKKEMEVREIRRSLRDVQSFVVSKSLSLLRNHNIVDKVEKTYVLKNDIFFRLLSETALQVLDLVGDKPKDGKINDKDLQNTANVFSELFFDNVSNILIHVLMMKPRKFNEIGDMYRSAHGYLPASTLRYHLSTRKIRIGDTKISIFGIKGRDYHLTEDGVRLHEIFDRFLKEYENSIEKWIHDMWKLPLSDLTTETVPIADLRDSAHKLLRILHTNDFVIAFSTEPKGIITTKNVMNKIGSNLGNVGFLAETTVEQIMTPIERGQIISGDTTLLQLFKKGDGFEHNHYVVDLSRGMYNVLSIYDVLKRFSLA